MCCLNVLIFWAFVYWIILMQGMLLSLLSHIKPFADYKVIMKIITQNEYIRTTVCCFITLEWEHIVKLLFSSEPQPFFPFQNHQIPLGKKKKKKREERCTLKIEERLKCKDGKRCLEFDAVTVVEISAMMHNKSITKSHYIRL